MDKITSISDDCILILTNNEFFRKKPSLSNNHLPSIGYGASYYPDTLQAVTMQDPEINKKQAITILRLMLIPYERAVATFIRVDINQSEFDALVAFTYNVGIEAFRTSGLLKLINTSNYTTYGIQKMFLRWVYSDGEKLEHQFKRRIQEAALFNRIKIINK